MSHARTHTIRGVEAVPLDAVADRVTRPGPDLGPQWRQETSVEYGKIPPATVPPPPLVKDLRGVRHGRLVAVGFLGLPPNKKGQAWLVRCDCGRYERRRTNAFNTPTNSSTMCAHCCHINRLREAAHDIATGSFVPHRDERPATIVRQRPTHDSESTSTTGDDK